ncbi:hypothetical protein MRB53_040851 [Persea americana]|nr:hypothetical protein MRB53_040851 [Persea americana]
MGDMGPYDGSFSNMGGQVGGDAMQANAMGSFDGGMGPFDTSGVMINNQGGQAQWNDWADAMKEFEMQGATATNAVWGPRTPFPMGETWI